MSHSDFGTQSSAFLGPLTGVGRP